MADIDGNAICKRVAKVRLETAGPRGKSQFARDLGIPPSTYDYYEVDRTPPAEILVRIAQIGGVDLRWLLTGEAGSAVPTDHPILQRAAKMLSRDPDAAAPLAAFLDILEGTLAFPTHADETKSTDAGEISEHIPHKQQGEPNKSLSRQAAASTTRIEAAEHPQTNHHETPRQDIPQTPNRSAAPRNSAADSATADASAASAASATDDTDPAAATRRWIPVLGRSAAGVPAFWDRPHDADGLTTLGELIRKHAAADTQILPATADGEAAPNAAVRIITLRQPPHEPDGPVEFVDAPAVKTRHADAFAVRIDGESMSPEIRHGDLVILSPSAPARAGRAAVVQLAGAIGVTCKLYHPQGPHVHLVPINETVPPTTVETNQIDWALRVLARVRP